MIGNMKRQLLAVAGLDAGIFFSNHLQAETLGPPSPPLWLRYPAISPDGKSIAFSFEGHLFTYRVYTGRQICPVQCASDAIRKKFSASHGRANP